MNQDELAELGERWKEEFQEPIPLDPFKAIQRCLDRLEEDRYAGDEQP